MDVRPSKGDEPAGDPEEFSNIKVIRIRIHNHVFPAVA